MKTKGIPAVVMLLAGFVTCIIGIVQHMETDVFIKTLLAVLIHIMNDYIRYKEY